MANHEKLMFCHCKPCNLANNGFPLLMEYVLLTTFKMFGEFGKSRAIRASMSGIVGVLNKQYKLYYSL